MRGIIENEQMLEMSRPESTRVRMDILNRAKIFAPFAALKGFEECIREQEIMYEGQKIITEDQAEQIDRTLQEAQTGDLVTATFFCSGPYSQEQGQYQTVTGSLAWEKGMSVIRVGDRRIHICDLFDICIESV